MHWKNRAGACGVMLLAIGSAAAWAGVPAVAAPATTSATTPAKHARTPEAGRNGAASEGGFTVAPPAAWVHPLAADLAAPIASAPYQILLADEQTRLTAAGQERFRHYVRRINDASALQLGGQINVDFDPSYEKLVFHKVDILRGSQRIDKLDAKKIRVLRRETQLERQMVDGRLTASLVLDDVRPGDRVEWEATIVGANPVFGGRFVAIEWSQFFDAPIGQYQHRLLAPVARDIRFHTGDPALRATSTVRGGERETLYRRSDVAQGAYDARTPPSEFVKAQFELSEFADWGEVDAWAQRLFAPAMQPTPALDAQVAALKARAATPQELLRATLDFVQKDIRYFATEQGASSHQPAAADTVLAQRFGDCKDKSALLTALLVRMGFDASPVLASLSLRGAAGARLPSPLAFDHVIVRVMVDGAPLFLDATRSEQTGAVAARQALNLGAGLEVRPGVVAPTPLPDSRETVQAETVDTLTFPRLAQEGTLESVTIYHGDLAESLRAALAARPRDEVERELTGETLRSFTTVEQVGHVEIEPAREDNSVKVTARYRMGEFWSFPEQRVLAGRFATSHLVEPLRLPDQVPRTRPLLVAAAGRYLEKVVFVFGEESPIPPDSKHFDESNKHFELRLRFDMAPSRQEAAGELHLLVDTIPAAEWAAYRDELVKVSGRLSGSVQVSALSTQDMTALRNDGAKLAEDVRAGRVQVLTKAQLTARTRLLLLDRQLAADRLQPKLRAQVLIARGEQLDHLGRTDEGRAAFVQAIAIDPANPDGHDGLAVNAFIRRDDAEALREVDETLKLSPSTTRIRYTRVWADYFNDRLPAARDELQSLLQSPSEVERGYGAIWLYLTTRRLGGDGVQAVKSYAPTGANPDWPYAALQYLQGRTELGDALQAAQEDGKPSRERECELYLFAGEKAIADGKLDQARIYLRKSVDTGVVEYLEYAMARRELDRLARR
jgi:lipoprotein NlpI/transglutaminase-like putative cysteine protease